MGLAFSSLAKDSVSGPLSLVFVTTLFYASRCGGLDAVYAPEVVPSEVSGIVLGTGQSLSLLTTLLIVLVILPLKRLEAGSLYNFGSGYIRLSFVSENFMTETKCRELTDNSAEMKIFICVRQKTGRRSNRFGSSFAFGGKASSWNHG